MYEISGSHCFEKAYTKLLYFHVKYCYVKVRRVDNDFMFIRT